MDDSFKTLDYNQQIYHFNSDYSLDDKISFLQRCILVHSYIYYYRDNNVWSDKKYDCICKQLADLQSTVSPEWLKSNTTFGYAFYDFDGSTAEYTVHRLNPEHLHRIEGLADLILYMHFNDLRKEGKNVIKKC